SDSQYNNTEHFSFAIPTTGQYTLRVRWTGEMFDNVGNMNTDQYGLAWSTTLANVPEPSSLMLLLALMPWGIGRRIGRHS
ncbi:MAG TPA: PEP-CTERM sorting domain-containing protein, partial [Lacipirellulaceae bacterium]|nr:PEP-CTERM sorting domain-containing protein [Lacipirellulaceae bacterium]